MKILYLSPEVAPFAKTGGLADAAGALPRAVRTKGHDIRVVTPRYLELTLPEVDANGIRSLSVGMHDGLHAARVLPAEKEAVPVLFVENEEYFLRDGYYGLGNRDYADNLERFVFFCKAALEACRETGFSPDVVHCNDWQTAALPALLKVVYGAYRKDPFFDPLPKTVYSIHNLSYQGRFPGARWPVLTLPDRYFHRDFEFYGDVNLSKGAIQFADAVTTVSPTYAREIRKSEFGFGLEGCLENRRSDLYGILNGADDAEWSPEDDVHTFGLHYSADDLSGKRKIRSKLRAEYGMADRRDVPLIGVVSRLIEQKGIDLMVECAERILGLDTQWILLGSGEPRYENFFESLGRRHPDRVAVHLGFHEGLAHRIEAAADLFLMPSLFEPCGLSQIYSLRYGTLPVVRSTGGLADTVREGKNGFSFDKFSGPDFFDAVRRAVETYRHRPEKWERMMRSAMKEDHSWDRAAGEYIAVYDTLLEKPPWT